METSDLVTVFETEVNKDVGPHATFKAHAHLVCPFKGLIRFIVVFTDREGDSPTKGRYFLNNPGEPQGYKFHVGDFFRAVTKDMTAWEDQSIWGWSLEEADKYTRELTEREYTQLVFPYKFDDEMVSFEIDGVKVYSTNGSLRTLSYFEGGELGEPVEINTDDYITITIDVGTFETEEYHIYVEKREDVVKVFTWLEEDRPNDDIFVRTDSIEALNRLMGVEHVQD